MEQTGIQDILQYWRLSNNLTKKLSNACHQGKHCPCIFLFKHVAYNTKQYLILNHTSKCSIRQAGELHRTISWQVGYVRVFSFLGVGFGNISVENTWFSNTFLEKVLLLI